MAKILSFDPGTNSLGMVLRDTTQDNLADQIIAGVDIIHNNSTRGTDGRHYSATSQRRGYRNTRTRYLNAKRRKQATLKLLIKNGLCPLDVESLNKWRFDIPEKGYDRVFPVHCQAFINWINMTNIKVEIDGEWQLVKSVYHLREILATVKLDFKKEEHLLALGRALYNIAVRRAFKSSRNISDADDVTDTLDDNENEINENVDEPESETKRCGKLREYMQEHDCPTVGSAFARMERIDLKRIRNNEDYKAVRSQLKEEIEYIWNVQGLDKNSQLHIGLISEKKHEGTIFYKNPLKSQKGAIERCSLEPNKRRCYKSHPENEFFVAWQLLNNIKIVIDDEQVNIPLDIRKELFDELFVGRNKKHFQFKDIREAIERKMCLTLVPKETINYRDDTNVSGCPVSYYLKNILGNDWKTEVIVSEKKRLTHAEQKTKQSLKEVGHMTRYDAKTIWHICMDSDEKTFVKEFAKNTLKLAPSKVLSMGALWEAIQDGYANLSLSAIRKINVMLERGYVYSDAVMLANLPSIIGQNAFEQNEKRILAKLDTERQRIQDNNTIVDIVNRLISEYKSLCIEGLAFAEHNYDYLLQEDDVIQVAEACAKRYGKQWESMDEEQRNIIVTEVGNLYQQFFFSTQRSYYSREKMSDALKVLLHTLYPNVPIQQFKKLYHHSDNDYYPAVQPNENGILQLGSPKHGALRNPNVLKVLYRIKSNVNSLLRNQSIDTDTIVVVENARELNDFNTVWAIEEYDKKRAAENQKIDEALKELSKEMHFSVDVNEDNREKARLALYQNPEFIPYDASKRNYYDKLKERYKLWLRDGFMDFYTGRPISLYDLFSEDNIVEVDHVLPVSQSFDDSLGNKVLTSTRYNRTIKKMKLVSELPNYKEDTAEGTAIWNRIEEIKEKVNYLEGKVNYWKGRSSHSADEASKNKAIKQMHLWRMEYEEWKHRLDCLTATEIKPGFRNSQLNDTRMISKYAYHYLKSIFGRVVVQRGETTAVFRKIFGLQGAYEKKNRDRHIHHAIDALTLSLIPYGPRRERMLETYYKIREAKRFGDTTEEKNLTSRLEREKRACGVKDNNVVELVKYLEETTLVRSDNQNNTLTQSFKKYRVAGKVVPQRNADGNVVYELHNGNRYIKPKHVSRGVTIRGEIHEQSIYGKVNVWKIDPNSQKYVLDENNQRIKEEKFVKHFELVFAKNSREKGFTSWEDLQQKMLDKKLFEYFKKQHVGIPFSEACQLGFTTMRRVDGNLVPVRVRRVRCVVSAKRPLKEHTFKSTLPEKTVSYVNPGDSFCISEYTNDAGKKKYLTFNLYALSMQYKESHDFIPLTLDNGFTLCRIVKRSDTLLVLKSNEKLQDILALSKQEIFKRLYRITSIEDGNKLKLVRHDLCSSTRGNTITDDSFSDLPENIRISAGKLNFLIMGNEFEIVGGELLKLK